MKKIIAGSSIAAMLLAAVPALASSNGIKVYNSNIGTVVTNEVSVGSNTGYNWVSGGNGGSGGDTGSAEASWGGSATSGNGGDGGESWNEGTILTGNALAGSEITNIVNSNDTDIKDSCGCENSSKIKVENLNLGTVVWNGVSAWANSGYNGVSGGNGGSGGSTGSAYAGSSEEESPSIAKSGSGGNGGSSTNWGGIGTGNAVAGSLITNIVNSSVTRIKR